MSAANFRRFWAMAANKNSSFAPPGPRRRKPAKADDGFVLIKKHLDLLSLPA
jgi:hypothetical protein